jgi:O-antigen ligase
MLWSMQCTPATTRERSSVGFVLFLLVTAIMFIRPTDFVPGLEELPLYQITIVPCIILSWHKLIPQLTSAGLRERPVFVFGFGILLVSLISNFVHGQFQVGFDFAFEFLKILIFFLLMQAQLDSPARLKLFLRCIVGIVLVPILLAVLHYHGFIYIRTFQYRAEEVAFDPTLMADTGVRRLRATGNFGDPNDVCEILNCALIFGLYGLLNRGSGLARVIWLAPIALLGHALALTESRGGFLGAAVGLAVLFRSRFRGTKSLVVAGAVLALMFVLFSGRQTSLSTSEGTSQARIQLWDVGFEMIKRSPLVGVGLGGFSKGAGNVAHNAFVQTNAELGLLAGSLLFGQYFYCLTNLRNLGAKQIKIPDPEMRRVQPFLLAALASFGTSEMSLTNPVCLVAYTMFGLATVGIRLANPSPPLPDLPLSGGLVGRIGVFSGVFLFGLYVFVRLNVHYG